MVSIPSSQIKHIIYYDAANDKSNSKKSKYQSNAQSIIKEAENKGYFKVLTAEYLNEKFSDIDTGDEDDRSKSRSVDMLRLIRVANLHQHNIQKLSCLEYCRNLVYVNLSKNFISDFGALRLCQLLICLDLSANLIESLPDFSFWSNMVSLRFLYLHDNPIANPDSIAGLSINPKITILTLWDTPLALRRKYRHFIVNSIWTLRVLDQYFVSDEEIIEDANFRDSSFRAMDNRMRMSSYRSYEGLDATAIIRDCQQLTAEINRVAAHLSPVLIIQKWIRGYLCRKCLQPNRVVSPKKNPLIMPQILKSRQTTLMSETGSQDNDKYLKIDITHLNKISKLEILDKEANLRNMISSTFNMLTYRSASRLDVDTCSPEHISRALDYGKNDSTLFLTDTDGKKDFGFKGTKPPTTCKHPSTEIFAEKRRCHNFIKESDKSYHDKLLFHITEIKSRPVKKTNSDTLFRKSQGCMGLFLLNKWDKIDRDHQEMEKFHERMNKVQIMRNDRDLNNVKLDEARFRKLATIKSQHLEHKIAVERAIESEKEDLKKTATDLKLKKLKAQEHRSKLLNELGFSLEFRSKQTAACKAINSFEHSTNKQERLKLNKENIGQMREKMKLEMETVKAYLESQSLNRRAEQSIESSALDLQIFQQTNNRMNDSKMRVEKLKSIRRLVSCPHLPIIQVNMESVAI